MQNTIESLLTKRQLEYFLKYKELKSFQKVADFFSVGADAVSEALKSAKKKSQEVAFQIDLIQSQSSQKRKNFETATNTELMELIQSQGFRCALTGADITDPSLASLDHIHPVNNGGTNKIENLQWVLNDVNTMKGILDQKRFIEICCMVAEYTQRSIPQKEAAQTGPWYA